LILHVLPVFFSFCKDSLASYPRIQNKQNIQRSKVTLNICNCDPTLEFVPDREVAMVKERLENLCDELT